MMGKFLYILFVLILVPNSILAQFGPRQNIDTNSQSTRTLEAADLDGDGDVDLLVSTFNMLVWYQNEDGLGNFGELQIINSGYGQSFSVSIADLDDDGDQDLLYTSFDDSLVIWYENTDGQGSFSGDKIISTQAMGADEISAADIDGDGDLDVLVGADFNNEISWFENLDGLGNFGALKFITNQSNGRSAKASDLDGDGDMDVVVSSTAPNNIVWFENTDGQGNFVSGGIISNQDTNVEDIILGDIDNDGDIDVLGAKNAEGQIALYKNDGLGNFTTAIVIAEQMFGVRALKVADLDNDGDLDVLGAANSINKFAWYENLDGNGIFGPEQIIEQGGIHHRDIEAADFDGDGDLDVAGIIQNEGIIGWYANQLILDVANFLRDSIQLTPNPTNGVVQVLSPNSTIDLIEVRDVQGKLLLSKASSNDEIDISNLSSGVFFVSLYAGKQKVIKRIIKI